MGEAVALGAVGGRSQDLMPDVDASKGVLPALRRDDLPLSVISEGDALVGRLDMSGHGRVLGRLDGHITCVGELSIGADAVVRADIHAHDLVLAGAVRGDVFVRGRLKIAATGRLEGDAQVGALLVEEGGVHFGLLQVYPDGVPDEPPAVVAERRSATRVSLSRPLAASIDRIKRMWREIF